MRTTRPLEPFNLPVRVDGIDLEIAGLRRDGGGIPLVFLHGFGSTKEDYADVVHLAALDDRPVVAYDAPGCGGSRVADPGSVSIPFLVRTAEQVLQAHGIEHFDLVGHSMGGLTALVLADRHRDRVLHFVDIEGNLAPEDCFLSRQIVDHPEPDPDTFMARFVERVAASSAYGSALYASTLTHKVRADVVRSIFESMVELSDHGDLLTRFLHLPMPRLLMYGEQNAGLSYLPTLRDAAGVQLAEIPDCGHFPMYSNASAMWRCIDEFVQH